MAETLDIQISLETPTGWVDLEDEVAGYVLHADTLGNRSQSHRKTEISNEYVAGTFVVRAVRENVTENIAFYVRGNTPLQLKQRVKVVEDGFDQLKYNVMIKTGDAIETWYCQIADHTMETSQPYQFATLALIRATVPRLPQVLLVPVLP